MATISDVEAALQALIYGALYPNAAPPSVLGYPVKIYAGWPDPATVDADMVESPPQSGKPTAAHVAIYPLPTEKNTTRYPATANDGALSAATYTLTASGQVITVGGAAPATYFAQNLAVFVDGKPYVTGATAGQTPAQLAAALQALIVADVAGTTVSGAAITVPAGARIGALRVGVTATSWREVRRQEKHFQIATLSSNPASRAAVADTFDPVLADTPRLALPDGTTGRLICRLTREDDYVQKQRVYRRIHIVSVEYATLRTTTAAQIVSGEVDTSDADGNPLNTTYA